MSALDRRTLLLAGLALPGASVARQERGTPGPPSLFQQVIKSPTGQNGYEEFIAAADELRASALFKEAEAALGSPAGCPLDRKRRILGDPAIARAMDPLRRGLSKPVSSPQPMHWNSATPELPECRRLARA